MNKEIPIILDKFVETEFGTGCVKITPAHDMNDYQIGIKHKLEIIEVFDNTGKMKNLFSEYQGLDILDARKKIVEKLKEINALVKIEPYTHNVGKCYRCNKTIEPMISEQWFVKMDELAIPAIKAVKNGETKFIPQMFEKTYFNWLENIEDWCISRQLWWGHEIPVYYCNNCQTINISEIEPEKCINCGCNKFIKDKDTLDTWFSSALWPFSTLGWPEDTEDFKMFFPTNTLVTGYDIIFFWVVRMMFSSLEQTGKVPFKDLLVHGIVRDSQGKKMSKSLGNGIDPLEIIDKYGADALRFSLMIGITIGNDMKFMEEKLLQAGNFANKIWNAAKFVLMNLEDYEPIQNIRTQELKLEDKWILSKINNLTEEVNKNFDNYDLGIALEKIYNFIWNEFCDWYIEIVKVRLYNKEDNTRCFAQYTLNKVLENSLKLLHPYMPFITEEIYQKLYNKDESIMISKFPNFEQKLNFEESEQTLEEIKEFITKIRNIRTNMNVHPVKKSKLIIINNKFKNKIKESEGFIKKLGFANEIILQDKKENISKDAISILTNNIEAYIPFTDLIDIEEEIKRLEGEKNKILIEKQKTMKMLSNKGFMLKAPVEKIKEENEKLEKFNEILNSINERLEKLK